MTDQAVGQTVRKIDQTVSLNVAPVALAAMAGATERGSLKPVQCNDFNDWQREFGDKLVDNPHAWRAAKTALSNGCAILFQRLVHYGDVSDVTTKTSAPATVTLVDRAATAAPAETVGEGAFPIQLLAGQTLVVSIDGGGNVTATFNATRATKTGASATYAAVTAGHKLVLLVNGVRREVAFAGSENTEALFLAAINDQCPGLSAVDASGQLKLQTDRRGSSAALTVHTDTAGDVLASLGLTTGAGTNAGPNSVADIDAVTEAEFVSLAGALTGVTALVRTSGPNRVPVLQTTAVGGGHNVQVKNTSTALDFGFDNTVHNSPAGAGVATLRLTLTDGAWGNTCSAAVADDVADPAGLFTLQLLRLVGGATRVLQTHSGLSMDPAHPRYVVNVLHDESAYGLLAEDLATATAAPSNRPAVAMSSFTGGDDGDALAPDDWIGNGDARTGLYGFDNAVGFRFVSLPGLTDHATLVRADAYCANRDDTRLIASVPFDGVLTRATAQQWRLRTGPFATGTPIDSSYTALYVGWHQVREGNVRYWTVLDGEVLAAFARSVVAGGPWWAPCGLERGLLSDDVMALHVDLSVTDVNTLRKAGINCAYYDPGKKVLAIEGQATLLRTSSDEQRLNVVLTLDFAQELVAVGIRPWRERPNDEILFGQIFDLANDAFDKLQAKRAFVGYRVVCDRSNNPLVSGPDGLQTHVGLYVKPTLASEEQEISTVLVRQEAQL